MRSKLFTATTVAILLTCVEDVSAHVRFILTYGNLDPAAQSNCLGYRPDIPNYANGAQHPYQVDTTVFSSPLVPAWNNMSPYYGKPRVWLAQGCGSTLSNLAGYWATMPQHWTPYGEHHALTWVHRDIHFQMRPIDPPVFTQTKNLITGQANAGRMCKASPGGYLVISTFQINADGAGPFRCRIDSTGTGEHFGDWLPPTAMEEKTVEGANGINDWGTGKTHNMRIRLPADIKCTAKYGKFENVCIARCENQAPNGPFGGCVPFQVIYPTPPPRVKITSTVAGPTPGTTTVTGSKTDTIIITETPKPTITKTLTDEEPGTTTVTGSKTDTVIITVIDKSTVTKTVTDDEPGTTTVTGSKTDTVIITETPKPTITKTVTDDEPGTTTVTGRKTDTVIITVIDKPTITTTVPGNNPGTTTITGDETDTVRITKPPRPTVTKTVTDDEPGTTTVTGRKTDTVIITVVDKPTITTTVPGKNPGTTTIPGDETVTVRITTTPKPTPKDYDYDYGDDNNTYNKRDSYTIRGRQIIKSVPAPKATTVTLDTTKPEPTPEVVKNPGFKIDGGKPESPPSQNPDNIKDPQLKDKLEDKKDDMKALLDQAAEEHEKPVIPKVTGPPAPVTKPEIHASTPTPAPTA